MSLCQVDDYMDQLDNNKIPKVGSVGEKYRDLQLMLQLPKQDLAADFCKQLSGAVERKAFNEFIDLRDSAAMDVGFVRDNLHHNVTVSSLSSSRSVWNVRWPGGQPYCWVGNCF